MYASQFMHRLMKFVSLKYFQVITYKTRLQNMPQDLVTLFDSYAVAVRLPMQSLSVSQGNDYLWILPHQMLYFPITICPQLFCNWCCVYLSEWIFDRPKYKLQGHSNYSTQLYITDNCYKITSSFFLFLARENATL